ncbi:kinesin [Reticulomyxa filosa]|uniref:Kinesin n=1 Tax=Reticulomyxa filosa TaxID=46433 RepID=X6LUE5_RETFI|nr:kinesin [Reticulomyxa filosa]|eukprot:ETO04986.1 kinesin [Reticulomyxa filosa]
MHTVGNYEDVRKLMNLAPDRIASLHCIFKPFKYACIDIVIYMYIYMYICIHIYTQKQSTGELRRCKVNLIDLAGSERVNKTGVAAGGERMEELKKINLSLNALGDVISALASRAKFIPFNNSTLTTLLRESLSGNSKTIMMAAISPAEDNFEESMSTLRYASRVKKIKTHARRNATESKQSIERDLRAEIDRLKKKLELQKGNQGQVDQITSQVEATSESLRRIQMEHTQKIEEMNKAYASISKTLLKMGITVGESEEKQRRAPKLINISSDPSLSGSMVFFLVKSIVSVGCAPQGANAEHERQLEVRAQKELERQIALNKGQSNLGGDDYKRQQDNSSSSSSSSSSDSKKKKKDTFTDGMPDILLSSNDPGVFPKHAIFTVRRSIVDIRQVALDERAKVWKMLFDDCDKNGDECLNRDELNQWMEHIVATDKGVLQKKLNCDSKQGIDFNKLKQYYIPDIEYDGISLLTKKLTADVQEFLGDDIPIKNVVFDKNGIRINASRKITMKEINTFEKFILDMFEDSLTGESTELTSPVASNKGGAGAMEALLDRSSRR